MEHLKQRLDVLKKNLDHAKVYLDYPKKIEEIKQLEEKTSKPDFWTDNKKAAGIIKQIKILKDIITPLDILIKETDNASELVELALSEKDDSISSEIAAELEKLEEEYKKFEVTLTLSGMYDGNNAIMTIHSGAGGTEACDWVEMLLKMYIKWAEKRGFKTEIADILAGEEAGIKTVTIIVKGEYAYGYLRSEIGVHRLVRISPFDANKRRHTSFCSVDVIAEVEDEVDVDIEDGDLRIDTYRASGHGGQHINTTDSAVRITHLPTGIVTQCQNERSQLKNKLTAMKVLKARLVEYHMRKKEEEMQEYNKDKKKIEWGSQIRSYTFQPYTLVKDHRTGIETGNVQAVMDGNIDRFIEAFLKMV
ncbi:peptide chain release factor 2 [bacterium]|nr:peptide chain release factor 2 [bacterium]